MKKEYILIVALFTLNIAEAQWHKISTLDKSVIMTSNNKGYYSQEVFLSPSSGSKYFVYKTDNDWQSKVNVLSGIGSAYATNGLLQDLQFQNDSMGAVMIFQGGLRPFSFAQTFNSGSDWLYFNSGLAFIYKNFYYVNKNLMYTIGNICCKENPLLIKLTNISIDTLISSGNYNFNCDNAKTYFFNDSVGYILCQDTNSLNILLRTDNFGKSWNTVLSDSINLFLSIHFSSKRIGYLTATNGNIFKSSDEGLSWHKIISPTNKNINSIGFINDSVGFFAGDSGIIFKTSDGGQTWQSENSTMNSNIIRIKIFNDYIGYAVTDNGVLLKRENIEEIQNKNVLIFKIYPNPSNSILIIELSQITKNSTLTIYNFNGQEIKTQQLINIKSQLDISNLTSGIYIVKLITDNSIEVRKIIKN